MERRHFFFFFFWLRRQSRLFRRAPIGLYPVDRVAAFAIPCILTYIYLGTVPGMQPVLDCVRSPLSSQTVPLTSFIPLISTEMSSKYLGRTYDFLELGKSYCVCPVCFGISPP
uniref:Uncharacterized protein n=1 Tax=Ixodes ricinus TaxID=34613 RepID=A0A6B0UK59_IXORI